MSNVPGVMAPSNLAVQKPTTDCLATGRLGREWRTMVAMIQIFCHGRHRTTGTALCPECRELQDYAEARLRRCRYGAEKPTCANCPVHCYAPAWRERIRTVMRYSGPRMLWRHPVLALRHTLDGRRATPPGADKLRCL